MEKKKTVSVNGNALTFDDGETILQVACRNSIDIPTLCFLKGTLPSGKCRVCIVEIDGVGELAAACETPAQSGMVIATESLRVVQERRRIIAKLLASGNHNCAVRGFDQKNWASFQLKVQVEDKSDALCPVWGDCRLQDLAYRYQVSPAGFSDQKADWPMEDINPFIVRDFSRCIQCGRCVKACREIQVNNAIEMADLEGGLEKVITPGDQPLKHSDCVFCGECVQACPVGALVEKEVRHQVRPWETETVRTTCSYCGVGCQMELHVRDNRIVKINGVEGLAPNGGSLCVKGRFGYHFVHSPERLTTPKIKENGQFRDASWEEAIGLVADKLGTIKSEHGGDSIGVLTSARITNEENYIAHKFTRAVLKTNNIDHCARL